MKKLLLAIAILFTFSFDLPDINDLQGDFSKGCVNLTWSPVAGADEYIIYRAAGYRIEVARISGTSFEDCDLTPSNRGWQYNVVSYDRETNEYGFSNFIVVKRGK